nr:MAG TPA: hypothetical protein [Caudoviricetes sp.]
MTYTEAKRILHPDTTREAIAEIEFLGGFNGEEKSREAVDEACIMACEALDKQIPERPAVLNQKGSKHFFCVACDKRLVSEINGELCAGTKTRFCPACGQAIAWRDDNGEA